MKGFGSGFKEVDLGFSFGSIFSLTEHAVDAAKALHPLGFKVVRFTFNGLVVEVDKDTDLSRTHLVIEAVAGGCTSKVDLKAGKV